MHLQVGPVDLSDDFVGHVSSQNVFHAELALAFVLVAPLFINLALLLLSLLLRHLDLLDHRRGLLPELPPDIDILLVILRELLVYYLLVLAANGRRNELHIIVLVDQLVALEFLYNLLGVILVVVRR